jgi:hypothetical protein
MCHLFQTSVRATYKLMNFTAFSFVDIFRVAIYAATHNYTYFSGIAERKRGAALRGQRKCSQAESPRCYHDLRVSALEDGYK